MNNTYTTITFEVSLDFQFSELASTVMKSLNDGEDIDKSMRNAMLNSSAKQYANKLRAKIEKMLAADKGSDEIKMTGYVIGASNIK